MNAITNDDRAQWAQQAVNAYTEALTQRGRPTRPEELAALGREAVEAYCRHSSRRAPERSANDADLAQEVIGDLNADLRHLADRHSFTTAMVVEFIRPDRPQDAPAARALAAAGADGAPIVETLLACLMAAAVFYDLDPNEVLRHGYDHYNADVEEEHA